MKLNLINVASKASMVKKVAGVALTATIAMGLVAAPMTASAGDEHYVLISHAPDSDSWWNTVKTAVKDAERDFKVKVDYRNPSTGDLADMARLVQQAAATNPDGIVVSIADFDVLKPAIASAVKKGIPVITINSGSHEQSEALGADFHVGQPEYDAGFGAGKLAKKDGIKNFLCVNHYFTNAASVERCQGFAAGLGVELGGDSQMIDSGQDPTDIAKRVQAYLRKNPNTEAILTLGPASADPTIRLLDKMRLSGKIYFGTFDLSADIATAIEAGTIKWAIDQQPYLQGYLPIMALTLKSRYGIGIPDHVNTGPGFVTKANLAIVKEEAGVHR
ncbi:MAG: sugar ABC transporter substrate-binding protein [Motiliproteus sp.]